MAKSIARLFILACTLLLQQTQASNQANITQTFQSSGLNTAIVYLPAAGYLAVTLEGNVLTVNNTFKHPYNLKPCRMTIDPFEDLILGRIRATGFLQQLIVWGVRSVDLVDEIKHTHYTMLLVNPRKCTYRPLELPFDEVPMDHPTVPPRVVVVPALVYGNEFYVFYQSLHRCAPCQYVPKDLRISNVEKQLGPPSMVPSQSMHIKPFLENGGQVNNGYVLAYNYEIGTTRVEYLDRNFETLETTYLNHQVDAISVALTGVHRQNVALCWQEGVDQITCERLDSRLYSTIFYHVRGFSISMLFDIYGNAFITTASKSGEIILHIYDVFGNLVDKLEVGTVSKTAQQVKIQGYFDYYHRRAFEHCLVVVEVPNIESTNVNYFIKCINIREYTEKP